MPRFGAGPFYRSRRQKSQERIRIPHPASAPCAASPRVLFFSLANKEKREATHDKTAVFLQVCQGGGRQPRPPHHHDPRFLHGLACRPPARQAIPGTRPGPRLPSPTLSPRPCFIMGVALLGQAFALGQVYISELVAWKTTNRLREDLARHCLRLDMDFHKTHKPGELLERVDNDVNDTRSFFSALFSGHLRHHSPLRGSRGLPFDRGLAPGPWRLPRDPRRGLHIHPHQQDQDAPHCAGARGSCAALGGSPGVDTGPRGTSRQRVPRM